MRIGIIIGRIGGEDGVALETEKWITVLERMGHTCHVVTGQLEAPIPNATLVPELGFFHPGVEREQRDCFFEQQADEASVVARLEKDAGDLTEQLGAWIEAERIEVLLSENASTIPCHLAMGVAARRVIASSGLPAVSHNHDFYWERGERYQTRFGAIREVVEACFPPRLPNLRHAVINSYGQQTLRERFGIESVVVPNVMDFAAPFGQRDAYNADLPTELGIGPGDRPLFQVTRVVRRKGIETAIELVHRLDDPRVKLFVTGSDRDDPGQAYRRELEAQVRKLDLGDRVFFVGDRFDNVRRTEADGRKVYALSDAYAFATAMTYFSTYEGFGNAFVEATVARVPVFVNAYEPVYVPDIGGRGFATVEIEKSTLTPEAVEAARRVIFDDAERGRWVEKNFALGAEHFSYEVLEEKLAELFGRPD